MARTGVHAAAAMLGLLAALVVVFDQALADLVPRGIWLRLALEDAPLRFTLLAAAGSVLAAVALARPPGFAFALVASLQMNGLRAGPLDVFDGFLAVALALLVARVLADPAARVRFGPAAAAAGLLVVIGLLHLAVETNVVRFAIGWMGLLRALATVLVFVNLVQSRAQLQDLVRIFVLVAVLSGALGILQFSASYFGGIHVTLIDPPETAFKPTPIGVVMRASGLCITAQHQSGFLALALPFALWRASESWRPRDLAAVLVIGFGILATWNMGAILATAAMCGVFVLVRFLAYAIHLVLAGTLVGVATYYLDLIGPIYDLLINQGVEKGVSQRGTLIEIALDKLNQSVLVGTGPQGFASFSGNYWGRPVHNAYIQAMTELGVFGMVTLIAVLLVLATGLVGGALRAQDREARWLQASMALGLGMMSILMLSEPNLDHSNTWFFFALCQSGLYWLNRPERPEPRT